jgi:hypothetical protein
MHPALMWLLAWAFSLVAGGISLVIVIGVSGFLQNKFGWNREGCIGLFGLVGFGCIVSSQTLHIPWLTWLGMLLVGWIAFMVAVIPLVFLYSGATSIVRLVRGDTHRSDEGN